MPILQLLLRTGEVPVTFRGRFSQNGMAYTNPTPPWTCAPLLEPKSGPVQLRFTVDIRWVKKYAVLYQYLNQNLGQELHMLTNSSYFATFDLRYKYWKLPLDAAAQVLQTFITSDGFFHRPKYCTA